MWKKIAVVVSLFIILSVVQIITAIEEPEVGSELSTPYGRWKTVANLPSAGTEPTDLAENERTYLTVQAAITADVSGDGKIIMKTVPYGIDAIRYRLSGIVENAIIVIQIYTGARDGYPDCELVKRGTLTFTIGTQESIKTTFEMADTIVISNTGATTSIWVTASPGNNTCCEIYIDMQGDDVIVCVGTTVECDAKLFMKDF